jgi:adenine phosphoribosyltransferase
MDAAMDSTANMGSHSSAQQSGSLDELSKLKTRLKAALRQFPDFPSPGILFEDIMPIFADVELHAALIRALELHVVHMGVKPDVVVGLDARGFLFGPSLALRLGAGFAPVRKQGKLPGECATVGYKKEYGEDFFQMQVDAVKPGQKVLIVDDIIATGEFSASFSLSLPVQLLTTACVGGSAAAAGQLVKKCGGTVVGYAFLLELDFLKGRAKLDAPVDTLLTGQEAQS